jgi:hypothetical protein
MRALQSSCFYSHLLLHTVTISSSSCCCCVQGLRDANATAAATSFIMLHQMSSNKSSSTTSSAAALPDPLHGAQLHPRRNSQRAVGILVCAVSERGVQHAAAGTAAAMAMELARWPRQRLQLPEGTPARQPICSFPPYPSVRLPFLPCHLPVPVFPYCHFASGQDANCFHYLLRLLLTAVTIQCWDLDQCYFIFLLLLLFYYWRIDFYWPHHASVGRAPLEPNNTLPPPPPQVPRVFLKIIYLII